jgi:ABC-type phosphate transport system substrate-binding protein
MRKSRVARVALLATSIALMAFLVLPGGANATTRAAKTTKVKVIKPSQILGSGSDTTYQMMAALDTLYNDSAGCNTIATPGNTQPLDFRCITPDPAGTITTENYPHDVVREAYPLGSSSGISQLCQQGLAGVANMQFARSSRTLRATDCHNLHFVAYARDGISWEAFPGVAGSPAAAMNNQSGTCAGSTGFCLTQQQLKDILLNCTITKWDQVGVPDGSGGTDPIVIYTAQANSGTRATYEGFVGGSSQTCIPANQLASHTVFENENTTILGNADAKDALFFFSFGVYTNTVAPNPDGSALGEIDGVPVNVTTIGDSTFPFGRFLFNVSCGAAAGSLCGTAKPAGTRTKAYVSEKGWLCKLGTSHSDDPLTGLNYRTEIANTISKQGFVPLQSGPIGGGAVGSDFCRLFTT